jgi:hypothetical protein
METSVLNLQTIISSEFLDAHLKRQHFVFASNTRGFDGPFLVNQEYLG